MTQNNCFVFKSRDGVIIECTLNGLFHDLMTVIIMSRSAVSDAGYKIVYMSLSTVNALIACYALIY